MQFYRILKMVSVSAGMLVLSAGTSGCAVETQEQDPCEEGGTDCLLSEDTDESVDTAEQEFAVFVRPDLAGFRFRSPFTRRVFLIDNFGYRRRIPNVFTYNNLFPSWDGIYNDGLIDRVALGNPFWSGAYLASPWGGGMMNTWLINGPRRSWIRGPAVWNRYGFGWNNLRYLRSPYLNSMMLGPEWY
jgi:hypothetical protein